MIRRPSLRLLIPAVVVGLLALFVAVGIIASPNDSAQTSSEPAAREALKGDGGVGAATDSVSGAATQSSPGTAGSEGISTLPAAMSPSGHYLMRTGNLSLLIDDGSLLRVVDRITAMTDGMGGYVVASTIGSDPAWPTVPQPLDDTPVQSGGGDQLALSNDRGDGYASMTVRVPERSFDVALRRYASLGKIESVTTSSDDVTSQYVDLTARLRHYRAVERRLLRFLAATESVPQMLAVQDRIDKVQLTIEQLSAELKSLREVTTFSTLTVSLREKGGQQAAAATASFGGTFWHSMKLLVRGARITALAITAVLPFAVVAVAIGGGVWLVARKMRRGRATPSQPTLPA